MQEETLMQKVKCLNELQNSLTRVSISQFGKPCCISVFTVPLAATLELQEVYNNANDGIIPTDGVSRSSITGCIPEEENDIHKELQNSISLHDKIVSAWGLNFSDSKYPKKHNLYHVIYAGEHNDFLSADLESPKIFGWASHVKCKASLGIFSGKLHTQDLLATETNFELHKRVYDRVVRGFGNLLPRFNNCTVIAERKECSRCRGYYIKVKFVNNSVYFINDAKYILGIYAEEHVTGGVRFN